MDYSTRALLVLALAMISFAWGVYLGQHLPYGCGVAIK
jgi:hypothetical protein